MSPICVSQFFVLFVWWSFKLIRVSMNQSIIYQFYFIFCLQDIDTILSKLQLAGPGDEKLVYRRIPNVRNENGSSPVCALISVKEATLVEGHIIFRTLDNERCVWKNNCRNNGSCCLEEVPVHQSVKNCVLLVKWDSKWTCEAILAGK